MRERQHITLAGAHDRKLSKQRLPNCSADFFQGLHQLWGEIIQDGGIDVQECSECAWLAAPAENGNHYLTERKREKVSR